MSAPYILARTFAEAHAFGRETLGLDPGYYRVVNSAGTLKSVRGAELYLVPGWRGRMDRFKMQTALRWTRMEVIDVEAEVTMASAITTSPTALPSWDTPGDPLADLEAATGVTAEELADFFDVGDPAAEQEVAAIAVAAGSPARRRRRCKECGILVEPDDVDAHAASHTEGE